MAERVRVSARVSLELAEALDAFRELYEVPDHQGRPRALTRNEAIELLLERARLEVEGRRAGPAGPPPVQVEVRLPRGATGRVVVRRGSERREVELDEGLL